jgi:integrase
MARGDYADGGDMTDVADARSLPPEDLSAQAAALWRERIEEFQRLGSLRGPLRDLVDGWARAWDSNMLRWWKKAAVDAKVTKRVWLHQLRHTTRTSAAELGMSSLEIAAVLGHAQASTSERYIHLARGVDQERAERIAARTIAVASHRGVHR